MHSLVWVKDGGAEYCEVALDGGLSASGAAIGSDPVPYRLEYWLRTSPTYVTEVLTVRAEGLGWWRSLDLRRTPDGTWTCDGAGEGDLDGPPPGGKVEAGEDCDLGLSPLTNTMPVLRYGLHENPGQVDLVMAWVRVPHLSVERNPQRYTHLDPGVVRYESEGFRADLVFTKDGLVADYPGLARLSE